VSAVAKGAKRNRSKFLSTTLQFCFGDYVLFKGKNLYTINESTLNDSFQELLSDLESITYASYLCELVDMCMIDEESNRELFKEFVSAFYLMKNKAVDFKLLARGMEIKLLEAAGYGLDLETCSICGRKINTSSFINVKYSGGICSECNKVEGMHISNTGYNILKYLTKTSISNIYKLTISEENSNEIYKILSALVYTNFGKMPKSLETLNYI
jgi:DNA repair protein RecO (recombination protein O)